MQDSSHNNLTLPCLELPGQGRRTREELVLTLVFHPDTRRIGERAVVPRNMPEGGWYLGRFEPMFSVDDEPGEPLVDAHVSRRALRFDWSGRSLVVQRCEGSSRCRMAGRELPGSETLGTEQLRDGVPLLLSHCVLLHLRLVRADRANRPSGSSGAVQAATAGREVLLGSSSAMTRLRGQLVRAANSDLDVLLMGETGTGKELAASVLHRESARANGPFVAVNMAAIPTDLAAAALFGAVRGAFTGAEREQEGYFEQAQGGSLFLDEVGDSSAEVQPLLLRALQQREIQRVGGRTRSVDVRVISATDARIDDEESGFKAALRYRLGACEIRLPALRERPEDIGELFLHFLFQAGRSQGREGLLPGAGCASTNIASWATIFEQCLAYHWPGNVRQLANVARQVVLASEGRPQMPDCLPGGSVTSQEKAAGETRGNPGTIGEAAFPVARRMRDVCADRFDEAMAAAAYEPKRVAQTLGVSRSAVYRRIEQTDYCLAHEIPLRELRGALEDSKGDVSAAAMKLRVSVNGLHAQLRRQSLS